jgi:hypothetical protein
MDDIKKNESKIEMVAEDLFNYAIDRRDVVNIIAPLPELLDSRRATLEHELQILKIISIGWSLSFYLNDSPLKSELTARFWESIHEFSRNLSQTTELLIHQNIDFFQTVRERFDQYLGEMKKNTDAPEPAVVIGPVFAGICGDAEDVHGVMAGSRMFINTVGEVKAYLQEARLR